MLSAFVQKQKRPNKDGPSVTDLFILTHTNKDGKPANKATADIIVRHKKINILNEFILWVMHIRAEIPLHMQARLREDSQKRTEGSTAHNSSLEFSKGPRGKAAAALQASFKEAMEAKQRAEDEADALKKKMMAMEENQRKMQEDLANMKSTVSAMNKTVPIGAYPPPPKSRSKRAKHI